MVNTVEFQRQRKILQRICLRARQHTLLLHLLKHSVTTLTRTLLMAHRVVVSRVLHHPHQSSSFLDSQVFRGFSEIDISRTLDANGIIQEIELVEIHLYYLVLGIITLQLHRNHPFYRLLQRPV